MSDKRLTHLDETGAATMVDVSDKEITTRIATAGGYIEMQPETLAMILTGSAKKGDVIATARLAGIMAAKRCHELIPLCHPLLISKVSVDFRPDEQNNRIYVESMVKLSGKTGVEMEALCAVSIACLTLYDMCKAVDRSMIISDIKVLEKSGGKSGHYKA
ncbi:Cyclic pyranopterin monophosphate synthase accessory protein [hydrothermal vent metagenome]|uniref:cyclic pyranopterin monophosphate synthase n=1 Tax=hydrothermal vent metagenome TaxID=652676 RepID=A0A3B0SJX4_9ZZZZ